MGRVKPQALKFSLGPKSLLDLMRHLSYFASNFANGRDRLSEGFGGT